MFTRKNVIRACFAAVVTLGLAACGGGADDSAMMEPTPQEVCEAADGRWNSDSTCTSAAEWAVERQHTAVSEAIAAAKTAVDGLSAMSSDAEVEAADGLIAAAKTALGEANLLSANQVFVLSGDLTAVETTLASTESDIADHRKMIADEQQRMSDQRMAANAAIDTANTAVAGLSATSTDDEVTAAKEEIKAAKDAVTAATALSMADRDALNDRISTIETMLAGTETDIADHRQMVADNEQREGVSDAIDDAMAAVGELDGMSTDDEVNAAKVLITAAKTALSDATSVLTAEQALALNARISTIETTLETTETAITAHRKQVDENAETQRVADVGTARMNAMQSYMDADADATKAEAAAKAAEETAPNSAGAMAARKAATAARTAAVDAKAAHDAITDDMTKADADAQAAEAATQAGNANSEYMTAKNENDDIQTAADTSNEQRRRQAVADARSYGGMAVADAMSAATNAATAASNAKQARDNAMAQYLIAKAARTDWTNAKKHADAAQAAYKAAMIEAGKANAAYEDAKMAVDGVMDDSTKDDADGARRTAESKESEAAEAHTAAMMKQTEADNALAEARKYADTHVLGLLRHANGSDVTFVGDTDDVDTAKALADARKDQLEDVVGVIEEAAAGANNINGAANATNASTAMATWPGVPDDPDTANTDESAGNVLMIQVGPSGSVGALHFRTAAEKEDDTDTADIDETIVTATKIDRLGKFMHGFSISDRGTHAIVFTDKTQDDAPVTGVEPLTSSEHANLTVSLSSHSITDLGTKSGDTYTGVTFYEAPTVDVTADEHDPGTAFMGSLTCPDEVTCNLETNADGDLIEISGYQFTGSRAARAAVTAMDAAAQEMANRDYLVFGVWLQEDTNGSDTDGTPKAFAAFADGGSPVTAETYGGAVVTGTATYEGSAAGVYTAGKSVDWFEGNATLTADFGKKPQTGEDEDTDLGTITGMIDGIVAGGNDMDDVIYLNDDDTRVQNDGNITATGGIAGDARMGKQKTVDDLTTYTYNGSWSGQFYNGTEDDDTTDLDESHVAPGSVAGTFGVSGINDMGTPDDKADDVTRSYVGAFGAHKQ